MTKQVILFNGPPRSGKDTATSIVLANYPNSRAFKMSQPLKDAVRAFFALDSRAVSLVESIKEEPTALLLGHSYRNVQISLSEEWAKEKFGLRVFGHLAANVICASPASLFVCSDSGFSYEAEPIVDFIGRANTLIVRLHRKGCDFSNDSRGYIEMPGVLTLDLYNNGERHHFATQLKQVIDAWLSR